MSTLLVRERKPQLNCRERARDSEAAGKCPGWGEDHLQMILQADKDEVDIVWGEGEGEEQGRRGEEKEGRAGGGGEVGREEG